MRSCMIFIFHFLCFYFSTVFYSKHNNYLCTHSHMPSFTRNQNRSPHNSLLLCIYEKVQINTYEFTLKTNILIYEWLQVVDINSWVNNNSEPVRVQNMFIFTIVYLSRQESRQYTRERFSIIMSKIKHHG